MKNLAIPNEYDGPKKPERRLSVPTRTVALDYVNSDNAQEIDAGIRDTIKGIRISILVMGIGLSRMKEKGLYVDLHFHSNSKYLESLAEETGIERSTVFSWLYIGDAYRAYQAELEKIGFTDEDGPSKLPYVSRALELYPKREVFKNLKTMTRSAFIEYAKGGPGGDVGSSPSKIRVEGNRLYIGKKLAVTFADELDQKTKDYLTGINVAAGEALEAGEVILPVRLYDMEELRRFERAANRTIKEMRINYKGKIK